MRRAGVESLARVKGEASNRREANTHRQSKVLSFDVWESQVRETTLEIHLMQQPSVRPSLPVQAPPPGVSCSHPLTESSKIEPQTETPLTLLLLLSVYFFEQFRCVVRTSRERTGYDVIVICVSCCVDWNDCSRRRFERLHYLRQYTVAENMCLALGQDNTCS